MTELGQTVGGPFYFWAGVCLSVLIAVVAVRATSRSDAAWAVVVIPFAGMTMAAGPAFFDYSPLWGSSNEAAFRLWATVFVAVALVAILRPRRGVWSH